MIILAENNAFQNIQKCIDRECRRFDNKDKCYHQLEDLLQFCVKIIFCENIHIAGNVPKNVVSTTKNTIEELNKYQIGTKVFDIQQLNAKEMKEIIDSVLINLNIDNLLEECISHQNDDIQGLYAFFPELSDGPGGQKEQIQTATKDINKRDATFFNRIAGFIDPTTESGLLTIVCREIDRIIAFVKRKGCVWTQSMMLYLLIRIKTLLNQELGESIGMFAPSVLRGKMERDEGRIFSKMYEIFDKGREAYRENQPNNTEENKTTFPNIGGIVMPALHDYIIHESGGDVLGVLETTAKLRDHFSPIRNHMNTFEGENDALWRDLNRLAQDVSNNIRGIYEYRKKTVLECMVWIPIPWCGISLPILDFEAIWESYQACQHVARVNLCTSAIWETLDVNDGVTKTLIDYCYQ